MGASLFLLIVNQKLKKMNKFKESKRIFKESDFYREGLIGFCLWMIEYDDKFVMEAWNHKDFGVVIVQVWPNGNGFTWYVNGGIK